MRKLHANFARLLAGIACLALTACFDIHEEVWIHRDGSGRAELSYVVPDSALVLTGGAAGLEAKIRELVATQPKIRLDAVRVSEADDEATIAVRLSTDSMMSLLDLQQSETFQDLPSSATQIAGTVVVRPRGLGIEFTRTIRVREALGLASLVIGSKDRDKRRLCYIIHLPKAAKETNATTVEDQGKTLIWEATLGEALKKPLVTSFRAPLPIPWFAWAAAGLLLVTIVALILRFRIKRRRRLEDASMVDL